MNHELYIQQALQQFTTTITDTAIAELSRQYSGLTINGIDDKDGYTIVRNARLDVKSRRIEVDKKRKELNEHALAHQRAVNAEAKRITALLENIEDTLYKQETAINDEIEKIQKEADFQRQMKLAKRIDLLFALDTRFNSVHYFVMHTDGEPLKFTKEQIELLSDDEFQELYNKAEGYYSDKQLLIIEQKQKEEEQRAALKLESERLEKLRLEQKAESDRLQAIVKEQQARDIAMQAESQRILNEKIAIEKAETDRLKALENAEIEKKKHEEEQKLKAEQLAKSEKNRIKVLIEISDILIKFAEKNLTSEQAITLIKRLI